MELNDKAFERAKQRVEKFIRTHLEKHECVYPSDIANELGSDYELVRELFVILEKEEKVCRKDE